MHRIKRIIGEFLKKHAHIRVFVRKARQRLWERQYKKMAWQIPVESNLFLFESYMGRQYACSPKAIYQEMIQDPRFRDCKFVWAFINTEAKREVPELQKAELVTYGSAEYYQYCAKAGCIITNSNLAYRVCKKRGQIFVQCWHGTPLKRLRCDIEAERGNAYNTLKEIHWKNDIDIIRYDFFLSPSAFASEKFSTAFRIKALGLESILLEAGYPRNDFLYRYNQEALQLIKMRLGLKGNKKKVILYAPTFRDNQHEAGAGYVYQTVVDFDRMQKELGHEYVILFRAHYFVANQFDFEKYKGFVYDMSQIDDINYLYIISDLLVTDYSSVFFDYANLVRPIIFYMYDLDQYETEIRGFYLSLDDLPGPIVRNEDELIRAIYQNDTAEEETFRKFNGRFNYLEDGQASKRTVDKILEKRKSLKE